MTASASSTDDSDDRLNMLEQCASLFTRLQADYYEEYQMYELSTLAVAVVYPLVSTFRMTTRFRSCRVNIIIFISCVRSDFIKYWQKSFTGPLQQ